MSAADATALPCDAMVSATRIESGGPVYPNLSAAVAAAPAGNGTPFRIMLGAGTWRERVIIDKPDIHLIGAGMDESILVFDRNAGIPGPDGKPVGTFDTATLKVAAPGFRAENLTIANDYDYAGNMPGAETDGAVGHHGPQAVALAIEGEADRSYLAGVRLIGHQDTFFVDAGRTLLSGCRVEGSVDFVFGGGRAFFDRCTIVSRLRPRQAINGFIAAPNTDVRQPVGLVFNYCRLEKEKGVVAHSVALGRPWRRTGHFPDGTYGDPDNVAACAYIGCWMDDHIVAEGWHPMAFNARNGGRETLQPEDVRFFEFASTGPGAGAPSARRRMLTGPETRAFESDAVLDGWRENPRPAG